MFLGLRATARIRSARARANSRNGSSRWPRSVYRSAFRGERARARVKVSTASLSCQTEICACASLSSKSGFLGLGGEVLLRGRDYALFVGQRIELRAEFGSDFEAGLSGRGSSQRKHRGQETEERTLVIAAKIIADSSITQEHFERLAAANCLDGLGDPLHGELVGNEIAARSFPWRTQSQRGAMAARSRERVGHWWTNRLKL